MVASMAPPTRLNGFTPFINPSKMLEPFFSESLLGVKIFRSLSIDFQTSIIIMGKASKDFRKV